MTIKHKKVTIIELLNIYSDIRKEFLNLLKRIEENNWNTNKDTRILTLNLINEAVQNKLIILHLMGEHFVNLKLWELQNFEDENHKQIYLTSRATFIVSDIRESLFINIFLRFENFIKIIAKTQNINGFKINFISKKLIEELSLNSDYKNLIDIFTYTRNTIHKEGFHSLQTVTLEYKGKIYDFIENEPLFFYNEIFLREILREVRILIEEIIESPKIKSIQLIEHTYANIIHEYEN